jgi:rhomboid family GlyGly-CTERM serine protease
MVAVNSPAKVRFPVITALVAMAAIAAYWIADGNQLLLYDRGRILEGDIWRLVSGHLVHFSPEHFGYNLILFALTGVLLEYRSRMQTLWLLALTSLVSSLYFLLFLPNMAHYGGLSGLASANVIYLSLLEIRDNRKTRRFWIAILLGFIAKLSCEILSGKALFVSHADTPFAVVPSVHSIGAIIAIVLFYACVVKSN